MYAKAASLALLTGVLALSTTSPSTATPVTVGSAAPVAVIATATPLTQIESQFHGLVRHHEVNATTAHRLNPLLRQAVRAQHAGDNAGRDAALNRVRNRLNTAGLTQVTPFAEHRLQRQLRSWLGAPTGLAALEATVRSQLEDGNISAHFAAHVQTQLAHHTADPGKILTDLLRLINHATPADISRAAQATLLKQAQRILVGTTSSSTGITIKMVNSTEQNLTLTRELKSTGDWVTHFPSSLPSGGTVTAESTSNNINGQHMLATYTSADGLTFTCEGNVPLAGNNISVGSVGGTDAASYTVTYNNISGYHPTLTCTLKHR